MDFKFYIKKIIEKYRKNRFQCHSVETRNRYKGRKYKVNDRECKIFFDNRCCGGCLLAYKCEHCVNCNCFGFTKSSMGGNNEQYHLSKCSENFEIGARLNKEGKFDFEYYYKLKGWDYNKNG